jgi:hypothetical protein
MVALFDRDVVEFDVIPILQRLMKDPFSAGNPRCNTTRISPPRADV